MLNDGYLLWMYLEAYTAGMNLLLALDHLHPEEGHEHPQLGVPLPVERVLRKVSLPQRAARRQK